MARSEADPKESKSKLRFSGPHVGTHSISPTLLFDIKFLSLQLLSEEWKEAAGLICQSQFCVDTPYKIRPEQMLKKWISSLAFQMWPAACYILSSPESKAKFNLILLTFLGNCKNVASQNLKGSFISIFHFVLSSNVLTTCINLPSC